MSAVSPSGEFMIALASNANADLFPGNTNCSFTNRLPTSYRLSGDKHKVAITELHYSGRYHNIASGKLTIIYHAEERSASVRFGQYRSYEDLGREVERLLSDMMVGHLLKVVYDEIGHAFYMLNVGDGEESYVSFKFTGDLSTAMGFREGEVYSAKNNKSVSSPDIQQGMTSLFVYCDLVEPWDVADSRASLLRIVRIPSIGDKEVNRFVEFANPQFLYARDFVGDTIKIDIRRDDGTLVPFDGGKTTLTLHIKPSSL